MEYGQLGGIADQTLWQDFTPRLDCWNKTGNTAPTLGADGVSAGRYLYMPERRLCAYDFEMTFGASGNTVGTIGSGQANGYLVELPIPVGSQMGARNTGGDKPLGSGYVCQGTPGIGPLYQHMPGAWTLSDTPGAKYGADRTNWCQMFVPTVVASGTGTIATNATSASITWPFPMFTAPLAAEATLTWTGTPSSYQTGSGTMSTTTANVTFPTAFVNTPSYGDIIVNFTSSPTASSNHGNWLTNISTTGFTINLNAAPTSAAGFTWSVIDKNGNPTVSAISATGCTVSLTQSPAAAAAFSYQVCSYTAVVMGAQAPFNVGYRQYDTISGSLVYETAY